MISAAIITLNEEKKIGKLIKSLNGLVNEIVVIDSGSNDKTVKVAESLGAKVFFREFDNFANQKNWAVSKTKGDWILAVDADEEIPVNLADEIKEAVRDNNFAGYVIPRRNFILGKEIKYSRWSPDKHIWLWRKDSGRWVGNVHEEVQVSGKVGFLKNSKIHNSHETMSSFLGSNNLYSDLEAKSLFKKHTKFSFYQMFMLSLFEFFIRFIYKLGFLDGKEGFVLAYAMSIYKLIVWIKLWELEKKG